MFDNNTKIISIATRIKELRQGCGMTQRQVAYEIGVAYQSYQAYEHGKALPSLDTLISLSQLFEVSSDYILGLSEV